MFFLAFCILPVEDKFKLLKVILKHYAISESEKSIDLTLFFLLKRLILTPKSRL